MRRHVLVARLDSDGDVLLSGPAIRAVASRPARVTLMCGPRGRAAAEMLPGVEELLVYRAPWIDPEPEPVDPQATMRLVDELAGRHIDEALILTSFHQSPLPLALLLRLAEVPTIAAISEDYPGSLLDVRHTVAGEAHEVERALSLAAALGYRLPDGDDGRLRVTRRLDQAPPLAESGGYVVVHPGASVSARAWGPEANASLVRALAARGRRVVVTGSSSEKQLTAVVSAGSAAAVDLGGKTDLAGLAEVLAGAEVVVVGNTGPAHLAAAVGTPVVSLFAPTVPVARWRPWRVPQVLLGMHDIACGGCRARECPVEGHPCLSSIPVEDVVEAVERLAGYPSGVDRRSFPLSDLPAPSPAVSK